MSVLVIDNYDSFTYNLVYILRQESEQVSVFRNDKISPKQCLDYDSIVLSPGPGIPENAGNLKSIISSCAGKIPILGVCLGHQAIAEHLGGKLKNLKKVYHGVQSNIRVNSLSNPNPLFNNLPDSFQAGRYHSWEVALGSQEHFEVTALTDGSSIMAIQNLSQNLFGIQFHPESVLTPEGHLIIQNFLRICKTAKQ